MEEKGRGRLSSIRLLPPEAATIVSWASAELCKNNRTQVDIYSEFVQRLEALKAEFNGELQFDIPGLRSFNRHSFRIASHAAREVRTNEVVEAMAQYIDPKKADTLTALTVQAIKSSVYEALGEQGDEPVSMKDLKFGADALRSIEQAQNISTARREKLEKDVTKAVDTIAKAKGLSAETAEEIKSKILGIAA